MRTRRRTASRGAALLTVALLGLAGLTAPDASAAPSGPAVAVAMGDSFISGEGGRWLGNTDRYAGSRNGTDRAWTGGSSYDPAKVYGASAAVGGCHRSDGSEIAAAPLPGIDERINLACSGAETVHVLSAAAGGQAYNGEAPQTDRLAALARTKRVKLIALSIGGNDLGFGQIIGDCAYDWYFKRLCSKTRAPLVQQKLPGVKAKVTAVVDDIRAAMRGAGYADGDYRLVLQSYPSPIPGGESFRLSQNDSDRMFKDGCPFNDRDATWAAYTLVPQIGDMVRAVAGARGTDHLDVRDALAGHEVCAVGTEQVGQSGPDSRRHEWFRFLDHANTQGTLEESMHPNAHGQRALAACLGLVAAAAPGRWSCTQDWFGNGDPALMRIRPAS
ncbi:GDSL-type esterase/lipase family protein [Streptomyces sp. NBC_00249]|uniref:GDSL-type esterase/lipase family protein n=1 Tax=Streptomyces sp. NBC_00249 TaxID=2975690 RepID=UPI0022555BB6|nr:GDSL-type esterase/lipase family protein [Streptomyces sp. NBC_00249]MCX5194247.1 GDSL-type esterase/lipase family protein [Streptomyces sp. NBC_00249]